MNKYFVYLLASVISTLLVVSTLPTSFSIDDTWALKKSWNTKPIYDGETGSFVPSVISYASHIPGSGLFNSTGLRLNPDRWHSPSIRMYGDLWRSDFGKFDFLEMYIRCPSKPTELTINLNRWTANGVGSSSAVLNLTNYIYPEVFPKAIVFNASWSLVKIPIPQLVTPSWSLNGVEEFYFNKDAQNRKCLVDNVALTRFNRSASPYRAPSVDPTWRPSMAPSQLPTSIPTRPLLEASDVIGRLTKVPGVLPLFDGETESFSPSSYEYCQYTTGGGGVANSTALRLLPDPWHSPAITLLEPAYRGDVGQFNELILYAKCVIDTPISVHFGRWTATPVGYTSANVLLGEYAEPMDSPPKSTIGGNTWTKVRIPIKRFFTADWQLSGAERLYFNSDVSRRVCWVDNIYLRENVGPKILSITAITPSHLEIEFNKYYRKEDARTMDNYVINQWVDSVGVKEAVSIKSIGLTTRFQTFKDSSQIPRNRHWVYLLLSKPLNCASSDRRFDMTIANISDPALNMMNKTTLSFNCSSTAVSRSIKVNQVGYLPKRSKVAYISDYFGDIEGGVWAVGANASIWTWNRISGKFTKQHIDFPATEINRPSLRAVVANSPQDIWVVGDQGTILHYNESSPPWTIVASPTTSNLKAIDFSPNRQRGFIVGELGTILRFVPSKDSSLGSWLQVTSPTAQTLRTVWMGADEAWIGGEMGVILKLNINAIGTNNPWSLVVNSPTQESILQFGGVQVDGAGSALCSNGVMLKNNYGNWIYDYTFDANLTSMFVHPTYTKAVKYFGKQGSGFTAAYNSRLRLDTNTSLDLTSIAFVDEDLMFAFGESGVCIEGPLSATTEKKWLQSCELPYPTHVYGATAVMEGPLRLPFPRPPVILQRRLNSSDSSIIADLSDWVTVGTYNLSLRTMNYRLSGEDVYTIDFTKTTSEGVHRLLVPGIGVSHSFRIAPDTFKMAEYHTCRMLYYQRSGMLPNGLQPPFAEPRFARPIDHEYNISAPNGRRIDAAYHWSVALSPLHDGEIVCPLSTKGQCPINSTADGSGGWFDAGDYSKYIPTGVSSVWKLLTVVDIMEDVGLVQLDNRNIPESYDTVPDTLNEASYEIDWMLKMQKPDGGVFNKVASELWESGSPETADLGGRAARYFLPRTTHDTASTGAIFAFAARLWLPYNASKSQNYLNRALLAVSFLKKYPVATPAEGFRNPAGHISGPYYDTKDEDNRAWLAAELYRTSCIMEYGEVYVNYINNIMAGRVDLGQNEFIDFDRPAAWAFYHSMDSCNSNRELEPGAFATVRSKISVAFKSSFNGMYNQIYSNTYMNVGRTDVPEWIGWGLFGLNGDSFKGILAWYFLKSTKYLDAMVATMDTVLGANPLGTSFITGLGFVYPRDPLQGQSRSDGVIEPIPGYGVMGPYAHVSFQSSNFAIAQSDDNNYPSLRDVTSAFPILRRWSDSNLLPQYNEGEIRAICFQCGIFQMLNAIESSAVDLTFKPSRSPTKKPMDTTPSRCPTTIAVGSPTISPSSRKPTSLPSKTPSRFPSNVPSVNPSRLPSRAPSLLSSRAPTVIPSRSPSRNPSRIPTKQPSRQPSRFPTRIPTCTPLSAPNTLSFSPSRGPTRYPTRLPSNCPSCIPTQSPTRQPSRVPSLLPSRSASRSPSRCPSQTPSRLPTKLPSRSPSRLPSRSPSQTPSRLPTRLPSRFPTRSPSRSPSQTPSRLPARLPSRSPNRSPSAAPV